jgi:hypothetical protein
MAAEWPNSEPIKKGIIMRRQDKIRDHERRERLMRHKIVLEEERGWAGQHGQHPETEEEENYRPAPQRPDVADENE